MLRSGMDPLRRLMGMPPIEKPAPAQRLAGTDYATRRDARLRAERIAKQTGRAPVVEKIARRPAEKPKPAAPDLPRERKNGTGVVITQCPPAVARGAYDAGRNLRASARAKAKAKAR